MIHVVYRNGFHDTVTPDYLDFLIQNDKVERFLRSSGWAVIGKDPVRRNKVTTNFPGPDRRRPFT